MKSGITDLY